MTLPINYGWSALGKPVSVLYEAPEGRRINALGGYFSHGPLSGKFVTELYVSLPKNTAKRHYKSVAEVGQYHGLSEAESHRIGPITGERFVDFLWRLSGRPLEGYAGWRRERPLVVILDNYSVHHSQLVRDITDSLSASNIWLFYLPSYSPELSEIEPIWNGVKHYGMLNRSYNHAGDLLHAVEGSLTEKASILKLKSQKIDK